MTDPLRQPAPRLSRAAFFAHVPEAEAALRALSRAVAGSGLDLGLIELVKLRLSQVNGCGFCTAYHLAEARRLGVAPAKLDALPVWREMPEFSEAERAALAYAEAVNAAGHGVPDALHEAAGAVLGEADLARLTVAVALIGAWNRIAATWRFAPPA
ncbi:carboxymuconolactone decarboxylase family protein [uncultured Methylobacterium sp.]|jgi:AhpD family alkylhydroperoxidase|uniref:carboxymuconolactone decarboxylase family protein n=1 Tax=uncultured Methylobacterium sp. TaxID=157278 RepID=UPI00262FA12D|nr:carboxymuconolactone decarboxylase family protein [uncultured Methylobacterium sp.]